MVYRAQGSCDIISNLLVVPVSVPHHFNTLSPPFQHSFRQCRNNQDIPGSREHGFRVIAGPASPYCSGHGYGSTVFEQREDEGEIRF